MLSRTMPDTLYGMAWKTCELQGFSHTKPLDPGKLDTCAGNGLLKSFEVTFSGKENFEEDKRRF